MRRTIWILGAIALICLLLVTRLFLKQNTTLRDERAWFAKELRYEFSASIDSIRMLNSATGKLWCHVTAGAPQIHREDSLKQFFKEHDMLYLIFKQSGDSIVFLVPYANLLASGDSLHVSSRGNEIQFFRGKKSVYSSSLSETLTGFGRPFFLKR